LTVRLDSRGRLQPPAPLAHLVAAQAAEDEDLGPIL
jgi:hypothetical protein